MGELLGLSIIGSRRGRTGGPLFRGCQAEDGTGLDPVFHAAAADEVDAACGLAARAFPLRDAPRLLRKIADGLEEAGAAIVARARLETSLPEGRLLSELSRTAQQLRMFAGVVDEGSWVDARIDTADPSRKPAPKPDVRSMRVPLGPVAVFGASNFPLAFSVAGGDTASALAAGNPVVAKAHPAHPGTCELVGGVIAASVAACGLHEGTFSLLFDDSVAVGQALVQHPLIQAVGFTGSATGGHALETLALARPRPIPVFAEMGSVNPVLILPGALEERSEDLAAGLHGSFTLGVGQFCTNPGVVFVPVGSTGDAFVERLALLTGATAPGAMLTARIGKAYRAGLVRQRRLGARVIAEGKDDPEREGRAALGEVLASQVLAAPELLEEVFGPTTLLVRYRDLAELESVVSSLGGQLSATVHGGGAEIRSLGPFLALLVSKAGRIVFNQFPTGVEVGPAMVHGGPRPATSDPSTTSVGTRAIERFSRFVAFQNAPEDALPPELRNANPRGLSRLVNGIRSTASV
jgi:alpha-ketoglutaric semialdehyde dehydrogenase